MTKQDAKLSYPPWTVADVFRAEIGCKKHYPLGIFIILLLYYMGYWQKELYEWVEREEFINEKEREVKEKKKEYAYFTKSRIDVNYIEWRFRSIAREEKEYEKNWKTNKIKICRITLQDDTEEIILKLIMNNTSRQILNTLVSKKILWNVEIRIGMDKKSWFSRIVMLNNGVPMEWSMSSDEAKLLTRKITDPETGEVIKTVYDKLEDKLQEMSLELQPEEDEKFDTPKKEEKKEEQEDDDLPL